MCYKNRGISPLWYVLYFKYCISGNICLILHFTNLCENTPNTCIYQLGAPPPYFVSWQCGPTHTISAVILWQLSYFFQLGQPSYHFSYQLEATLILCKLWFALIPCKLPAWGYPYTMSVWVKSCILSVAILGQPSYLISCHLGVEP